MGSGNIEFGDDDVVGILVNGVLLDSHAPTWSYDSCNGHSDTKHQYHYHIPPACLDGAGPSDSTWWINETDSTVLRYDSMPDQFPQQGQKAVVGFARDGFPIFSPYKADGSLVTEADVDECNGLQDGGEYGYAITPFPPFAPPCLKGEVLGLFAYATTSKRCPAFGINNTIVSECPGTPFSELDDAVQCTSGVIDGADSLPGVAMAACGAAAVASVL